MSFEFSEECEEWGTLRVKYSIVQSGKFAVLGTLFIDGKEEQSKTPYLFFTKEEATAWCQWLTENKVLPSSLNYVLSDEFYVY